MKSRGTEEVMKRMEILESIIRDKDKISIYDLTDEYILKLRLQSVSKTEWQNIYNLVSYAVNKLEKLDKIVTRKVSSETSPLGKRVCKIR